jgi:hypothetical protein
VAVAFGLAVASGSCGGAHQPREVGHSFLPERPSAPQVSAARTTTTATTAAPAARVTTPPTTRAVPPPTVAAPVTNPPRPVAGPGLAVGDSVLEDVKIYAPATLASRGFSFNAAVSRQWAVGVSILSQLRAAGQLPPVVIVALGSNGRIDDGLFDQMMQACSGAKRVVFMTVTGPLIGNNPIITAGVRRFQTTATLADWASLAAGHPDWFGPDHVHMGPAGATALGNLLASVA